MARHSTVEECVRGWKLSGESAMEVGFLLVAKNVCSHGQPLTHDTYLRHWRQPMQEASIGFVRGVKRFLPG